jgi:hypothetical protein
LLFSVFSNHLASVSACSGSLACGMVVVVEDDFNLVGDKWRWAISHRPYLLP